MKKNLVEIIKANPTAVAIIDNDCWWLMREPSENNPYLAAVESEDASDEDWDKHDAWDEANKLANDRDIEPLGTGGYGSGCCYGGDILQALAQIVGLKVESV
ncbi:MAG: hypothetical protein N0E44_18995 [Candidatus Thiodiazotropha lotti]|nr:hypothetical protein [Candidatus Thiodiazotropha lotti]MCW4221973.1 hypothetical protein [Candidatus Thiodiazotropha lotti]